MSNSNIAINKNNLVKTCSILLTVIFFILSFLTGFNNVVTFGLGIILLGLVIYLSFNSFKSFNYYVLGIVLIPIICYGVIMSLSYFSNALYSLSTRIFLTLNLIIFTLSGYFFRKVEGFNFRYIFTAIFASISIICLINAISTLVCYGPFYGFVLKDYSSYYDGVASRTYVSNAAYVLCGFSIKEVPIEFYLIYPFMLLTSIFLYLLGNKKDKFNIISNASFVLVAIFSLIIVISKSTLIYSVIYLLFIALISLVIIYKKYLYKPAKYVALGGAILFSIFFIILVINAQYDLESFRAFISSNKLLNRLFNVNRIANATNVLLNGVFSKEKLIGFPPYFDYSYNVYSYPSNNVLVNQFMYGGLFGFIFFIVIIALFIYLVKNVIKSNKFSDRPYKYFPLLFVISYFVITMFIDQNSYDLFKSNLVFANYLSQFFYMSLFVIGHYYSVTSEGGNVDEK